MIDKIPEGLSQVPRQRQVTVRSSAPTSKVITLNTDVEGHFCAEVEPGMYVIEVRKLLSGLQSRRLIRLPW